MISSMTKMVDGLKLSGNSEELELMGILLVAVPIFANLAFCFGDELVEPVCLILQGFNELITRTSIKTKTCNRYFSYYNETIF